MFSRLQSGFLWVDCNFLRAYENWWNRTKVLPDAISYRCATVVPWRFPGHVMVGKWSPHFLSWSYQSRKELSWPIYASKWNNSCCGLNDHMPNRLLIYIYTHVAYTMLWPWQISWFFWVCCDFVRWRIPYPSFSKRETAMDVCIHGSWTRGHTILWMCIPAVGKWM